MGFAPPHRLPALAVEGLRHTVCRHVSLFFGCVSVVPVLQPSAGSGGHIPVALHGAARGLKLLDVGWPWDSRHPYNRGRCFLGGVGNEMRLRSLWRVVPCAWVLCPLSNSVLG